jgi:heme/copper-type cytochrome/quinol oxidase subunit 4
MSWIFWLGLAVAIGIVAAVTGMKPSGTRPVARTRLMGMARFVLVVLLLLFLYLAYRGYSTP